MGAHSTAGPLVSEVFPERLANDLEALAEHVQAHLATGVQQRRDGTASDQRSPNLLCTSITSA